MDKEYLQGRKSLVDPEYTRVRVLVTDIDYEISEEDCEENDLSREEIEAKLPKQLELDVEYLGDDFDLENAIAEEISNKTGWLVNDFYYTILEA
ncbi:MAG: hypothetical protein J6W64_07985 [Bacilli bacterium]|nr:hypothetical protein [Bacilli bacterium]